MLNLSFRCLCERCTNRKVVVLFASIVYNVSLVAEKKVFTKFSVFAICVKVSSPLQVVRRRTRTRADISSCCIQCAAILLEHCCLTSCLLSLEGVCISLFAFTCNRLKGILLVQ